MNFYSRRFNLYLLLLTLAFSACGCFTTKKKPELLGTVRIHVERPKNVPGRGSTISVVRADPVLVTVSAAPVLTEANLIQADLIDSPGGFAVRLRFDETGAWLLEQCTASNPGRHLAIFGQWGKTAAQSRWLAAPLITHRIGSGVLTFTPDASREEMQTWVKGLNNAAKQIQTGQSK